MEVRIRVHHVALHASKHLARRARPLTRLVALLDQDEEKQVLDPIHESFDCALDSAAPGIGQPVTEQETDPA